MKVTHNSASGKTVITLSWTETRQFISLQSVRDAIGADVQKLVKETSIPQTEERTFRPIGKVASDSPIFNIGDNVIVHKTDADEWLADEFMAKIADILDNGDIIVEDQDSDFFTVKPYQLEHNND